MLLAAVLTQEPARAAMKNRSKGRGDLLEQRFLQSRGVRAMMANLHGQKSVNGCSLRGVLRRMYLGSHKVVTPF